MQATGQSLKILFDTQILEVPFFQRSYVWNKDNWEELLDDLLEAKTNHFLGSIILKNETTQSWEPRRNVIIDGQQRLTTLSILTKALYDCMKNEQKDIFKFQTFALMNCHQADCMLRSRNDDTRQIVLCFQYFVNHPNKTR